jgi:hypothetical protein
LGKGFSVRLINHPDEGRRLQPGEVMSILKEGQTIVVDGDSGKIFLADEDMY